ncbi:MAG: protein kinase, partial [Acidobacteria bacterium]|nr:protein kinase [Acidobacteriota bacterium]
MIGKTLSHYKILEQIGAGGMGVVYRARDERLERDVALKVLPADALPDEDARKRFRKEALALSSLNHPNIATVFDFDHQEGVDFLAMEFIAGESLAEKLQRGPLSEKEIASLGGQIASALDEAHEHGVVHRDLKPGNVMVTPKGQAKVLDFGLAKLLRSGGDADLTRSVTETKAVAGTLPYMAPEQLSGEPLDARTDIHALGAVLYEMATGQRPFREQSVPRLTDAILHQPPVSARVVNARVSPELDRIILKCLEKDPENRYQSAKEVAVDLRRLASPTGTTAAAPAVSVGRKRPGVVLTAGIALVAVAAVLLAFNAGGLRERLLGRAGPPQIKAIAVLPLENLSRDPEQEYFTDGMTEALISNLAQIGA